jgi:hypothetical protein
MNASRRLVATLVGTAAALAVVGCSNSGTTTISSSTSPGPATSVTGSPAMTMAPSSPSNPPTTTSVAPQLPQAHGSAGSIDVTIAAQDPTTLRPGGPPMRFSVKLVNTATAPTVQVGLVVSLGHCSCGVPGPQTMPAGTMQMLDPDTKTWVTVPYVREGTGMDYIGQTLVPPFVLEQGQTMTYELQVQLNGQQNFTVKDGESAINVVMTDYTTNKAIGVAPTASLPITVEP